MASGNPLPDRPDATDRAQTRILVVEDNDSLRVGIAASLRAYGTVDEESDGAAAVRRIADPRAIAYDLVVTDLRLPAADGYEVLAAARSRGAGTRVIVISAYGTLESAVGAMRLGASDFLQKPFRLGELDRCVDRVTSSLPARLESAGSTVSGMAASKLVMESPAMRAAVDIARRAAPMRSTILITGETGTGKELVAALLHDLSPRAAHPFVKVNCAALPVTLLESELFGHERGAFTGADRRRIGRFEQANRGTLFLDEIGDMSLATQVKLLRVLQEREFQRLGGVKSIRADVRVVAATNRNLSRALREGTFRQDLFFRLNVIEIHLPPLRERPEDTMALADHFLSELSLELGRPRRPFANAALARIRNHRWSGNVRELRNVVERGLLLCDGAEIEEAHLFPAGTSAGPVFGSVELPREGISLREVERSLVLQALDQAGFVQKDAARLLQISRRKLNYMIRRMGLTHPSWRRNRGPEPGSHRGGAEIPGEGPQASSDV